MLVKENSKKTKRENYQFYAGRKKKENVIKEDGITIPEELRQSEIKNNIVIVPEVIQLLDFQLDVDEEKRNSPINDIVQKEKRSRETNDEVPIPVTGNVEQNLDCINNPTYEDKFISGLNPVNNSESTPYQPLINPMMNFDNNEKSFHFNDVYTSEESDMEFIADDPVRDKLKMISSKKYKGGNQDRTLSPASTPSGIIEGSNTIYEREHYDNGEMNTSTKSTQSHAVILFPQLSTEFIYQSDVIDLSITSPIKPPNEWQSVLDMPRGHRQPFKQKIHPFPSPRMKSDVDTNTTTIPKNVAKYLRLDDCSDHDSTMTANESPMLTIESPITIDTPNVIPTNYSIDEDTISKVKSINNRKAILFNNPLKMILGNKNNRSKYESEVSESWLFNTINTQNNFDDTSYASPDQIDALVNLENNVEEKSVPDCLSIQNTHENDAETSTT